MERSKLILGSLVAALGLFSAAVLFQAFEKQSPISSLRTKSVLTIGEAPLEVVLIEDFECRNCMTFSKKIIPQLTAEYVESGKVKFTLVPVSFLAGSQAVGNALLEVKRQVPNQAFAYLQILLKNYEATRPIDPVQLARKIEGVDLAALQESIETGKHNAELQENLNLAKGVMGSKFRTPALYINGAPGSTFSFEAIQYQIDQLMEKQ